MGELRGHSAIKPTIKTGKIYFKFLSTKPTKTGETS